VEAYGVEYVRHGITKRAFAKKEVIISAGTLMSPHLLMHSGIGPKNHLEENKVSWRKFSSMISTKTFIMAN